MNERIRELAEQAGIITEVWKTDAEGHGYKVPNYEAEKFAELIVKECICQCDDENSQKYIMAHFGMKESDWS